MNSILANEIFLGILVFTVAVNAMVLIILAARKMLVSTGDVTIEMNQDSDKSLDGEIYISLDRALENSKVFKEPYEKEIIRLVIHGCLHLIGFDDQSLKEKQNMTKMEDKFLALGSWEKLFRNLDE